MIETNNGNKFAFDAIKIGMASPEQIREWSYGCLLYTSRCV